MPQLSLLALVATAVVSSAAEPRQPRVVTLYRDSIADVYVSDEVTTVLQFAETVTMVTGTGLSDGTSECSVQFEHPKNSRMIVLRGVAKEGRVLMQAMTGSQFYAFNLISSDKPDSVVRLSELAVDAQEAAKMAMPSSLATGKLDEVVSRACASFEGKQMSGIEMRRVHNLKSGEGFQCLVEMAARSSSDDVVILKGLVTNSGASDLPLSEYSAVLLVGESREISPVTFRPSQPIVAPGARAEFVLAAVGDGGGGRANYSIKNRFDLVLRKTK